MSGDRAAEMGIVDGKENLKHRTPDLKGRKWRLPLFYSQSCNCIKTCHLGESLKSPGPKFKATNICLCQA